MLIRSVLAEMSKILTFNILPPERQRTEDRISKPFLGRAKLLLSLVFSLFRLGGSLASRI